MGEKLWHVSMLGPVIEPIESVEEATKFSRKCQLDTRTMLYRLNSIPSLDLVAELTFTNVSMLSAPMFNHTRFQEFPSLKKASFINCRKIDIQGAVDLFPRANPRLDEQEEPDEEFAWRDDGDHFPKNLEIIFCTKIPNEPAFQPDLKGSTWLAFLFRLRDLKYTDGGVKILENLCAGSDLGSEILKALNVGFNDESRITVNEVYEFVKDDAQDRELRDRQSLIKVHRQFEKSVHDPTDQSGNLRILSCDTCDKPLPGLCFPKSSRHGHGPEVTIRCCSCLYYEALDFRYTRDFALPEPPNPFDLNLQYTSIVDGMAQTLGLPVSPQIKPAPFDQLCPLMLAGKYCNKRKNHCELAEPRTRNDPKWDGNVRTCYYQQKYQGESGNGCTNENCNYGHDNFSLRQAVTSEEPLRYHMTFGF